MALNMKPFENAQITLRPLVSTTVEGSISIAIEGDETTSHEIFVGIDGLSVRPGGGKKKNDALALIIACPSSVQLQTLSSSVSVAAGISTAIRPDQVPWCHVPKPSTTGFAKHIIFLRPLDFVKLGDHEFVVQVKSPGRPTVEVGSSLPATTPVGEHAVVNAPALPRFESEIVEDTPAKTRHMDILQDEGNVLNLRSIEDSGYDEQLQDLDPFDDMGTDPTLVVSKNTSYENISQSQPLDRDISSQFSQPEGSLPAQNYATAPSSTQADFQSLDQTKLTHDSEIQDQVSIFEGETESEGESQEPVKPLTVYSKKPVTPARAKMVSKRKSSPAEIDSGYASTRKKRKVDEESPDQASESASEEPVITGGAPKQVALSKTTSPAGSNTKSASPSIQRPTAKGQLAPYDGPPLRIAFSNTSVLNSTHILNFLKKHGCTKIEQTEDDVDLLVIGKKELKKTSKFLRAIALGSRVITDEWVVQSAKAEHLVTLDSFVPSDPEHEKEWGFKLNEALQQNRRSLLKGRTIYFTPSLKKDYKADFKDIEAVVKLLGAEQVLSKAARNLHVDKDTIILAMESGDIDGATLADHGHACYEKGLLSIGILRGRLNLDSDEFKIPPPTSQHAVSGRGSVKQRGSRGRKR